MSDERERGQAVVPSEVTALLEERACVQGWLRKLASMEGEARPDVYDKVEADYRSRLAEVGERLSEHRAALLSSLDEHRERVAELQEQRDGEAAELEEARLRHAVGEFDEATWSERRQAAEASLEELDARLSDANEALEELSGVLEALPGDGPAGEEVAEVAGPPPEPAAVPAAVPAEAPEEARLAEAPKEARPAERTRARESSEAPAAGGEGAGGEDEPRADDYLDELEFLESLSLDDSERFDAVSMMLEEEDEEEGRGEEEGGRR